MSLLFMDTEFTGLHKDTSLISLGIIDELGNTFYAEFNDYDIGQVDDWIEKNVISNLEFNDFKETKFIDGRDVRIKGSKDQIREALSEWLSHYTNIQFVSDVCHYDFVLLIDIFGNAFKLPENVSPCCHDINQDIASYLNIPESEAFNYTRENFVPKEQLDSGKKHNALFDAIIIKYIYHLCNDNT